MAKKDDKEARKAEQAAEKYLKSPTSENAEALRGAKYIPHFEKAIAKHGRKYLKAILDFVAGDDSPEASAPLKLIEQGESFPLDYRLKAIELLEARKAEFDKQLKSDLLDIVKIAKKNDEKAAKKLYPTLSESLQEAFATAIIEHDAVKAFEGAAQAEGMNKPAIKILRRAAHVLSSKGHKVPEIEEKSAAVFKPPEKEIPQAFVTHIDRGGARLVFLAIPGMMGAMEIFQGIIDEKKGLTEFEGAETNRRNCHTFIKHAREEGGGVPVDPVYASWLLDKAAALATEKHVTLSPEYLTHRVMLPTIPPGYAPPDPRDKFADKPTARDAGQAKALFDRQDLYLWAPDGEDLQVVQLKLDEIMQSHIIISEEQRKEQIEKAFIDAAIKYLQNDGAARLAARLENSAYLYTLQDQLEPARLCLAEAEEIKDYDAAAGKGETPAGPPEFVVEMFRRVFKQVLEELAKLPPPPAEKKTDSGIIVP